MLWSGCIQLTKAESEVAQCGACCDGGLGPVCMYVTACLLAMRLLLIEVLLGIAQGVPCTAGYHSSLM